ncbi:SusD/RagB family nutrient-binding outer membrane lipoprotein [Niastella caeni]|uniref:SusD/RagB family nutrient-binding outer membrane lipoprotein n=1 Tax=Niastella caeni TaxID=2569763 RepID=A0A4S8HZ89_9BACT|nr:SusD/RagB family nutrient-binding outer membrane lipoprotein [Niastella caeni]THU40875.1 SusD/RagB family nutrient-binding outer membrane lipoprotein [Niastella caeni]
MKFVNINKSIICVAALLVIIAGTSCKKGFLDVNDDPNRSTDKNIRADLLFPQAAVYVGNRMATNNLRFLNCWMGYFAQPGDFAILQDETSYSIDFTFGDNLWQNHYDALYDLYLTKVKALAVQDSVLAGSAMVLSARLFQDLVDIFGNIPYSQAFQTLIYRQPAYDKGQDVYNALQKSLDSAITFLHATPSDNFEAVDIVNHGDATQWIKFANTLKLRLLIHQSQMAGFNPAPEIAKIISNGGVLHAGEDIDVNPGFVNENAKQSPFYANFGNTPTGADASTSTRANAYFVDLLGHYDDARIERFFNPVGTSFVGATYGLVEGNPGGAASSRIGPGLAGSATQDAWIFPAYESMFLEAEAIARGWMPGDVQTAYEAAVTESFVWLGVEDAADWAHEYLTTADIAIWANAGSSVSDQVKFIAFQKYIALGGVDPTESWSDLRRLNMIPDNGYISVNPSRISNTLPVRLLYPQSEYTANGSNVRAQGTINQFTSKIFWQP